MSLASVFSALATDQTSLSEFVKQIPAGICVYDPDARPLLSNELFTQIVGIEPRVGQQASPSPLTPLLDRARGGETVLAADIEFPADGSPQRAQVSTFPVRDHGRVVAVIAVVVDAGAERGQRETMGVVGHDLRNPLAAIRMTAQLLAKPDDMASERRIALSKRILTSSTRMDSIVKSLLDYARAKAGALVTLERERVDLGALSARVIEEHTTHVTGRSIELRTVGDVVGTWDPGRVEQIVGHLVSNALRHGTDGPATLTVEGSSPDRVAIVLQNRGPAIPAELLPRIFDPFQIGPRPPGTPRRSIGLGLFVVRQLAEAHGGSVAVQSSDTDGTQFTVSLPRSL